MTSTTFQPTTFTPKFQRTYQLLIQAANGSTFTIGSSDGSQPILTLEFNINRAAQSSTQSGNIRIRNLNAGTRNAISKNFFSPFQILPSGLPLWQGVILQAGYVGTPLSTIFYGKANTIMSYREEGGTDWITEIDGTDFSGLFGICFSSWTDSGIPNYTQQNIITHLVNDLQNCAKQNNTTLGIGVVNGFPSQTPIPPRYSYTANDFTMNLLSAETNRLVYIDNGKIYAMPSNYVFKGDVTLISSTTGLIGSPRVQTNQLVVQMIFEPGMVVGQSVYLDTELTEFSSLQNGTYKVIGVQHAGIISSTSSGKCITTVTLQYIPNAKVSALGLFQN